MIKSSSFSAVPTFSQFPNCSKSSKYPPCPTYPRFPIPLCLFCVCHFRTCWLCFAISEMLERVGEYAQKTKRHNIANIANSANTADKTQISSIPNMSTNSNNIQQSNNIQTLPIVQRFHFSRSQTFPNLPTSPTSLTCSTVTTFQTFTCQMFQLFPQNQRFPDFQRLHISPNIIFPKFPMFQNSGQR